MNEPHRGYVEMHSMHAFDYNTDLHLGPIRTYAHHTIRAMRLTSLQLLHISRLCLERGTRPKLVFGRVRSLCLHD